MKNHLFLFVFCFFCFNLSTSNAQVVINEFSAANIDQFFDNYGSDEDWIELYNTGTSSVDLSGYYLSDKLDNPTKFQIPAGVSIGAGGHLLVWASGRDENSGSLHTNFKITQTKNSEAIVLAGPSGTIIDFHDIEEANQLSHSWARITDGSPEWGVALNPSPENTNTNVSLPYAPKPSISPAAGFYTGSVSVEIESNGSDLSIYYTTDGSIPDAGSTLYNGAFNLSSTAVVKAISISSDPNVPPSFVDFHSIFINDTHTIPVASITGDNVQDLLDGSFIDPIGTFELFDESGDRVADASGDFNKHGNDSWAYAQRGIDFITRDQLGDDHAIKHAMFNPEITDRDEFQRIILKAAANDNYPFEFGGAHIRDAYVHTLSQLANLELDERTSESCILYVNGKYWGVYELREKVDDHDFTKYYYDQGRQWIDFIKTWGGTWEEYGSWDDWYELRNFIENNDMTDAANYAYVEERLEVMSLIDYMVLHSHNVSSDWLNWNTGWWRGRNPDGGAQKWRYILWDEDATFGHYINYSDIPDQSPEADPCNPETIGGNVDFEGHVAIFTELSQNPEFFALYISRYADLNNTYFTCEYMVGLLDEMTGRIQPEMQRHIDLWGGSMSEWEDNVETLRDFILTRCTVISGGIVDCYEDEGITGPFTITIDVEPVGSGNVQANTISGINYPWIAEYFGGIPFDLTALPESGFVFSYWQVANHTFGPDQFQDAINMSLDTDDEITAFFQPAIPCGSPFNFETDSTMTSLNILWNGPVNNISFEVQYRKSGDPDWIIFSTVETDIIVDDLEVCSDYDFQIRTICDTDVSSFQSLALQTACSVAANEPNLAVGSIAVFPNPFKDRLNIEVDLLKSQDLTINVLTITGQTIQSHDFKNRPAGVQIFEINVLESIPDGMYLVAIQTDEGTIYKKLVKA